MGEGNHTYFFFFKYLFFLRERSTGKGCGCVAWRHQWRRVGCVVRGWEGLRHRGRGSQRTGRACTTGSHAHRPLCPPLYLSCLSLAAFIPASRFLETRFVCAQDLLGCWLVCEFYQDSTQVYFSLSAEITAFIQEKSDSKRAVPALLPEASCVSGLPWICWFQPEFSARFRLSGAGFCWEFLFHPFQRNVKYSYIFSHNMGRSNILLWSLEILIVNLELKTPQISSQ